MKLIIAISQKIAGRKFATAGLLRLALELRNRVVYRESSACERTLKNGKAQGKKEGKKFDEKKKR